MLRLNKLQETLEVKFRDPMLLLQAITHRSYPAENPNHPVPNNERLEFLGDAVLELVVTEHLYFHHNEDEGGMTASRGAMVNLKQLGKHADTLRLGDFILMSKGQLRDTSRARLVILGDCFEALIGAMYLDGGLEFCRNFLNRVLLGESPKFVGDPALNPKSNLQEVLQDEVGQLPTYRLIISTGPEHNRRWSFGVYLGNLELGRGNGASKKEAQVEAARNALARKAWIKS